MGLKLLAGDYTTHRAVFKDGGFHFWKQYDYGKPAAKYKMADLKTIEEITEDNKVSVLGAAGWGILGTVVAGPFGLVAGALLGGRGKTVVFSVEFNDGKRSLIEADSRTWTQIMAANY